ncbi:MAG: mannose-1-phosphate guanylyltransferase [Deltaproteobacteria bacterium]|nr:mannose-1-phosphate guanylyltransferase [Deltaproteobacteria bacterium]
MYAIIMAGGRGTRFWPLSRDRMPKHLLAITGKETIIQQTIERIRPLIPERDVYIITNKDHYDEIRRQCPDVPKENIIAEPMGRNTAPCIGLAATYIKRRSGDGVMAVLPADHLITDERRFLETLAVGDKMARRGPHLITIGIGPTAPETGYGYIEEGEPLTSIDGHTIYRVASFREKPDRATAEAFIRSGSFYWNSGTFVWKASTIMEAIGRFLPDLYDGLETIGQAIGTSDENDVIRRVYESIDAVSIDYGIMEKWEGPLLIKGRFGWNDIGSWDALYDVFPKDQAGNAVSGRAVTVKSHDSVVYSPNKLVAMVGVDNLVVVETDDALLICDRNACQDVKEIVRILETEKLTKFL